MAITTFSVLICTYNRSELLHRALIALIERSTEKPDQVVVVNGGNDKADLVAEKFMRRHGIKFQLVKTINKNLAASRNIGLPFCTGDIVAMTDDDAEVFPDWVTRMKSAHQKHPEAGAIGGLVWGANPDSLIDKLAGIVTFPSWDYPHEARTLPGVNISYKREAIRQTGSQDETLFRGEDVDYNWRIQKLGYKIYYDPAIQVYHHHRQNIRSFLHQHYMYGRAYYLVRQKWPDMYCVYPHGIRRPWDVAKAVNFIAALFYRPVLYSCRLCCWRDRLLAVPLLFALGIVWEGGMIYQWLLGKIRSVPKI